MDCFSGKSSRNWLVVAPPHNPNLVLNSLDVPFAELWKQHFQKMTTNMGGPPTNIEDAFPRWTSLEDVWITFDSPGKRSIFVARSIITGEHGNARTTSYHGLGDGVSTTKGRWTRLILSTAPTSSATLCFKISKAWKYIHDSTYICMPYASMSMWIVHDESCGCNSFHLSSGALKSLIWRWNLHCLEFVNAGPQVFCDLAKSGTWKGGASLLPF